jgi:hypothetical protein
MASITDSIRGTVQGVVRATAHAIWWVSWHTNGSAAVRTAPRRPVA